jgi:hypothetical protein
MKKVLAIACLLAMVTISVFPHSGGLDSSGGHYNRKTGEYHYHRAPAPPPTTTTIAPPAQSQSIENIVYITKTGEKFHAAGCRYLANSKIPIERSAAVSRGFGPCSVCRP